MGSSTVGETRGSARRVPLPSPSETARVGAEEDHMDSELAHDEQGSSSTSGGALELIQDYWHFGFFAYGAVSIISKQESSSKLKSVQIVALALLLGFMYKLERLLSRSVFGPLFAKIFGNNDELRAKIEKEEAELRKLLREHGNKGDRKALTE